MSAFLLRAASLKFSLLSIRVGAEASPSRMHVEISLPEGGQLFRVKINQKSHFAAAMGAVELLHGRCGASERALPF